MRAKDEKAGQRPAFSFGGRLKPAGGLVFLLIVALVTAEFCLRHDYTRVSFEVCDIVRENYYLASQDRAVEFDRLCHEAAENQVFWISKSRNIRRINARLSALRTSHLNLYDRSESAQIWDNVGFETGIRARRIEGQLVVDHVLLPSPAARAGILAGDSILSLNDDELVTTMDVQMTSGHFRIRRGTDEMNFDIRVEKLVEDLGPRIDDLGQGIARLNLGSFLPQYFDAEKWQGVVERLNHFKSVIIDLRGNSGGSFPAMLRAVSPFFCSRGSGVLIGSLYHFTRKGEGYSMPHRTVVLDDELDNEKQLDQLGRATWIELRTFSTYGCFKGAAVVLTDAGTASTAEIFASIFRKRPLSKVMGQSTAGEVVMARWFEVDTLGDGYLLSVPVAGFVTPDGEELEGRGIQPQKLLYDNLALALRGQNSWVVEAESALRKMAR